MHSYVCVSGGYSMLIFKSFPLRNFQMSPSPRNVEFSCKASMMSSLLLDLQVWCFQFHSKFIHSETFLSKELKLSKFNCQSSYRKNCSFIFKMFFLVVKKLVQVKNTNVLTLKKNVNTIWANICSKSAIITREQRPLE